MASSWKCDAWKRCLLLFYGGGIPGRREGTGGEGPLVKPICTSDALSIPRTADNFTGLYLRCSRCLEPGEGGGGEEGRAGVALPTPTRLRIFLFPVNTFARFIFFPLLFHRQFPGFWHFFSPFFFFFFGFSSDHRIRYPTRIFSELRFFFRFSFSLFYSREREWREWIVRYLLEFIDCEYWILLFFVLRDGILSLSVLSCKIYFERTEQFLIVRSRDEVNFFKRARCGRERERFVRSNGTLRYARHETSFRTDKMQLPFGCHVTVRTASRKPLNLVFLVLLVSHICRSSISRKVKR